MLVCSLVVFIYAIILISFFKGSFHFCWFDKEQFLQEEIDQLVPTVEDSDDCLRKGGYWTNAVKNFDSIAESIPVLMEIITTEGWLSVMYSAIDSRGVGLQPKRNHNMFMSIFFISFIIVGNIFILNLFVGIVIDKFNRLKDKMCGYLLMTRD
mmetsp:Transcript_35371/g.54137  ORF Transcript_35371/g.54137 Transcript_35371/m.54137 type:complete len:153 (+) Transcript_35371:3086-3544(+)